MDSTYSIFCEQGEYQIKIYLSFNQLTTVNTPPPARLAWRQTRSFRPAGLEENFRDRMSQTHCSISHEGTLELNVAIFWNFRIIRGLYFSTVHSRAGAVKTHESGYWVSSASSLALQSLEGEEGSYVMAYPCWLQVIQLTLFARMVTIRPYLSGHVLIFKSYNTVRRELSKLKRMSGKWTYVF